MPDTSLYDSLQLDVSKFLDMSAGSSQAQDALLKKGSANAADSAKLYDEIGKNQAIIEAAKLEGVKKVEAANLRAAQAAGADPSEVNNRLERNLAELVNAQDKVKSTIAKSQEMENISFLDDPMKFLKVQLFEKGQVRKELSQSVDQLKVVQGQTVDLNNALQETTTSNKSLAETTNAATIAAAQRVQEALGKIKGNEARATEIEYDLKGYELALKAPREAIGLRFQLLGAAHAQKAELRQNTELQFRIEAARRAEESHGLQMRIAQDAVDEAEQKRMEGEIFKEKVNAGRAVEGLNPITNSAELRELRKLVGTEGGKEISRWYKVGERVKSETAHLYGQTPAESVSYFQSVNVRLSEAGEKTKQVLADAMTDLKLSEKKAELTSKPENAAARARHINNFVQDVVDSHAKHVTADATNLHFLGKSLELYDLPAFANSPVIQKVLKPAGLGFDNIDANITAAVGAVRAGKITTADLGTYLHDLKRAVTLHQKSAQFERMGIIPPSTYRVTVAIPHFAGKENPYGTPRSYHKMEIRDILDATTFGEVTAKKLAAAGLK